MINIKQERKAINHEVICIISTYPSCWQDASSPVEIKRPHCTILWTRHNGLATLYKGQVSHTTSVLVKCHIGKPTAGVPHFYLENGEMKITEIWANSKFLNKINSWKHLKKVNRGIVWVTLRTEVLAVREVMQAFFFQLLFCLKKKLTPLSLVLPHSEKPTFPSSSPATRFWPTGE